MNNLYRNDTIVAIATAAGEGGIGIVRVSGQLAQKQLADFFRSSRGCLPPYLSHRLYHGHFCCNSGSIIDEVLAVVMREPNSFTGEDVVEFHCHGGPAVLKQIIEIIIENGIRLAFPGEFSRRAFLNGRIDLSQAEAIADIISAKTARASRIALGQLNGGLRKDIQALRNQVLENLALVETHIDFGDEDIVLPALNGIITSVEGVIGRIDKLLASFQTGRFLQDGVRFLILGAPNVGKSSLLNCLLGEERAIVTEIPGTTRDLIEEHLNIQGFPIRLIDTAGLRESSDPVEQEGIRRTREKIAMADLVLLMIDASRGLTDEDWNAIEACRGKEILLIRNKVDKGIVDDLNDSGLPDNFLDVSCKTGTGLDDLKRQIVLHLEKDGTDSTESVMIYNARHFEVLHRVKGSLGLFLDAARTGKFPELLAVDLHEALASLSELTGESVTEEMLDLIFSRFCIGK